MLGQDNLQSPQMITFALGGRHPLAAQTQDPARVRSLRHCELDRPRHRRNPHFGSGQGFTGSYGQDRSDVVAIPAEQRMRLNVDLHQCVPWLATLEAGLPLSSQPQRLAVLQPGWDGNLERLAVVHSHAFLGTVHRLRKSHRHRISEVGTSGSHARSAPAEHLGEQVVPAVRSARLPAPLVLEAGARLGMLAVKLALGPLVLGTGGIYLAAVETRSLLLVTKDVIGRGDAFEACFRAFVAGMQVWVSGLGEPAVGLADFLLRGLAADTQDFVRVRHRWDPRAAFRP